MIKPTHTLQRLIFAAVVCLPLSGYAAADAPPPPPGAEQGAAGADKPEFAPGMHAGPQDGPQRGAPGFGPGPGGREGGPGGPGPGGPGEGGPGPGPFGHGGMPPFLHGLELTEAQDDKLFAIVYAQQPQLREQHKIIQKSHEALRELKKSGKYDDAKAVTLVQAGAQAMAKIELLKLRGEQQILALLTPEQRQKMTQHAPGHGPEQGKDKEKDGGRPSPRPQQK